MKSMNSQSGFTLIEVLIAIVLLAIALFSLAGETTLIIGGNSFSKMQTVATTIARDQIETMKSAGFSSAASSTGYPAWTLCTAPNGVFRKRWQVVPNADSSLKTIAVDVAWDTHVVTLNTIVAR